MKHYFGYGLAILALLACLTYIVKQEIAVARADERSKAAAETQKQIDTERAANQAKLDKVLGDLEAARNKPATVQSVTKYLPAPLPQGSEIQIVKPTPQPTAEGKFVIQPDVLQLTGDPQKNLQWIQGMEIAHRECDAKLDACGTDKDLINRKLLTMTADRDTWRDTAKGGSKTHRFLKVLKCAGVAGGGAAIGSFWGPKGAAIGGATGSAGCAFFW